MVICLLIGTCVVSVKHCCKLHREFNWKEFNAESSSQPTAVYDASGC